MATMIKEVYDALIDAGASDEKARKAAEAISSYENRFNKIERDLLIIKWMIGLVIVVEILPYLKAFS